MTYQKEWRKNNIVETFTNCVPTLPEEHLLIHGGYIWLAQQKDTGVDSDASKELLFVTSNTRNLMHMVFSFASLLGADYFLYEDTEKTYVSGNAITPQNRNRHEHRDSSGTIQICHTPAGSGDGTLVFQGIIGSGSGPQSLGGNNRDANEIVLKPNTKYLARITSRANSNETMISAEYYERFHHDVATTTTTTSTTTTTTV
jgi:hypothetical protein